MSLVAESGRRRTFAIISHPDAGKTTLTEKLLLYSGAIRLAGSVKSRRASRHTVSDWMKMERERGISISSSVLQFDYDDRALNLLDTPGHADFSEDTYRTLAAVDSSLMLIDHAKGVEARTLKLFQVCRRREMPIVTFINKLDRDGLDPVSLIDEISQTLDLAVAPINWPIGMGRQFKGVVDLRTKVATLYGSGDHGTSMAEERTVALEELPEIIGEARFEQLSEELELVEMAGDPFIHADFEAGLVSPVFWGSAVTNAGVEPVLRFIAKHAPSPRPVSCTGGESIRPEDGEFTGFIFKIQANMNPRHRDRIAFLRVVSGEFRRGDSVTLGRTGERIRLAKPHSFVAAERAIVDQAYPGDIVGLHDPGKLRIGDTLCGKKRRSFNGIPRFAPAFFGRLTPRDPLRRKALDTGLEQLAYEGVIQLFYRQREARSDPVLGAVGQLQFEVLKERLAGEYKVEASFSSLSYAAARWVGGGEEALNWLKGRRDYPLFEDRAKSPVLLVESEWSLSYALENAPSLELYEIEPL